MATRNESSRSSVPSGSVFDTASKAFELLVSGPEPLAIDGGLFDGFPRRAMPLDELARLLLDRRCTAEVGDAVWAHLVGRSRVEGGAWTVACVGVALPGLISCARKLAVWAPDPADVHAAVLTGFLTGLASLRLDRPWVLNRLMQAARRAGQRAVREESSAPMPVEDGFESRQPPAPWGHPDLVLADAVAAGVITRDEADMIGATRLEDVAVRDCAAARGMNVNTFRGVRWRAERRLAAWLAARTSETGATGPSDDGDTRKRRHPKRAGATANKADSASASAGERVPAGIGSPQMCVPVVSVSAREAAVPTTEGTQRPGEHRPPPHSTRRQRPHTVTGSSRRRRKNLSAAGQQNGDLQTN